MGTVGFRVRCAAGVSLICAVAVSLICAAGAYADEVAAAPLGQEEGVLPIELTLEPEDVTASDAGIVLNAEEPLVEDALAAEEPETEKSGKLVAVGSTFRYEFDDGSFLVNDWQTVDGKTYYFNSNGNAVRYGQTIDERFYYFNGKGVMHRGLLTWGSDGRKSYFGEDGAAVTGWQTVGGKRYYFGDDFKTLRYGQTIDEKFYYFGGSGAAHVGWLTWHADGRKTYFGEDGAAVVGWQTIGGKRYCFDSSYKALRYTQHIDGVRYYFNGSGVMHVGWLKWGVDGTYSYFDSSGAMLFGEQTIHGVTYDFGVSGKVDTVPALAEMSAKAQSYASKTKYLILVDTKANFVGVFTGSQGAWMLDRSFVCTSGAPASPTVKGSFTVGNRGTHFGENKGYTCWYWTQFYNDYLFHSVLYEPHSKTEIQDGRLGQNLSHGCVRLEIDNAKWIYDNIPSKTAVIVY